MELHHRSIPRFTKCVSGAFGLSALVYMGIAGAGYLTFGGNSDSYILNNYSARDPLATACRLLVGISVLTIYPIGTGQPLICLSLFLLITLTHGFLFVFESTCL